MQNELAMCPPLQGSGDSDYSLQSSEFSTDNDREEDPVVVPVKETEAVRKQNEKLGLAQLDKSRVRLRSAAMVILRDHQPEY